MYIECQRAYILCPLQLFETTDGLLLPHKSAGFPHWHANCQG